MIILNIGALILRYIPSFVHIFVRCDLCRAILSTPFKII